MNKDFFRLLQSACLFLLVIAIPACNALRGIRPETREDRQTTTDRKQELRRDVVSYAQQFKGTRYAEAGKTPKTGFDCSGFTGYVLRNFEVSLSASSRDQAKQGRIVPLKEANPGDLVFFRRSDTTPVFHVAMIVSNDRDGIKIIHSTNTRGVVVDNLLENSYWEPKIYQVRDVLNANGK
ncbi:MAG: C40 family peptidase [Saprospiraceae bacterium]|nr:C40 family peptidase [Saprospiraceae bacterium]